MILELRMINYRLDGHQWKRTMGKGGHESVYGIQVNGLDSDEIQEIFWCLQNVNFALHCWDGV